MFRVEFEKIVSNIVFYMCILGSVILLLSGTLYKDSMTGEEYTLINIVINHNTEVITTADLHGTDVIAGGVGGYFDMFLSIVVAIPFVMVVCGEKKNSNTRFEIYRIGKNRFFL